MVFKNHLLDGQIAEVAGPLGRLYRHTGLSMFKQWIWEIGGTIHPPAPPKLIEGILEYTQEEALPPDRRSRRKGPPGQVTLTMAPLTVTVQPYLVCTRRLSPAS